MKVHELIEALEKLPRDAEIIMTEKFHAQGADEENYGDCAIETFEKRPGIFRLSLTNHRWTPLSNDKMYKAKMISGSDMAREAVEHYKSALKAAGE